MLCKFHRECSYLPRTDQPASQSVGSVVNVNFVELSTTVFVLISTFNLQEEAIKGRSGQRGGKGNKTGPVSGFSPLLSQLTDNFFPAICCSAEKALGSNAAAKKRPQLDHYSLSWSSSWPKKCLVTLWYTKREMFSAPFVVLSTTATATNILTRGEEHII